MIPRIPLRLDDNPLHATHSFRSLLATPWQCTIGLIILTLNCLTLSPRTFDMTRSWGPEAIVKAAGVLILIVSLFIIILGGGLNNIQVKYSRYNSVSCAHGLFIVEVEDSQFCCDEHYHETDWACAAAYDPVNRIFSSYLAWFIPLVPFVCTVMTDFRLGSLTLGAVPGAGIEAPGGGDKAAAEFPNRPGLAGVHSRRLVFYLALFVFRRVRIKKNCNHFAAAGVFVAIAIAIVFKYFVSHDVSKL